VKICINESLNGFFNQIRACLFLLVAKIDSRQTPNSVSMSVNRSEEKKSLGRGATSKVSLVIEENGEYIARKQSREVVYNTIINNEFVALSMFKKPYIRRVFNFQNTEAKYSFDMDYYECTLFQKMGVTNSPELSRYEKFVVIYGISKTVETLLSKGLIHRDIKPSNIMLNTKNYPVLSDFGILRKNDNTINSGKGTPIYIYPLFIDRENKVNQFMDVYSIGVLICDLFFGLPREIRTAQLGAITRERFERRFSPKIIEAINDPNDAFGDLLKRCISIDNPITIQQLIQYLDDIFVKEFLQESARFSEFQEWLKQDSYDTFLPHECNTNIKEDANVTLDALSTPYVLDPESFGLYN